MGPFVALFSSTNHSFNSLVAGKRVAPCGSDLSGQKQVQVQTILWVLLDLNMINDANDHPRCIIVSCRDIVSFSRVEWINSQYSTIRRLPWQNIKRGLSGTPL